MNSDKYPEFLTVKQTAEILNIPENNVYQKIKRGNIEVSPHGKPYRIIKSKLFEGVKNESSS